MATRIFPLIRQRISPEYAAYSVERDQPDLLHALTSYVTLRADRETPGLRGVVVRSIGARAARHLTASGMSMPTETMGGFRPGLIAAVLFAALILYTVLSPKNTVQSIQRLAAPFADIQAPSRVAIQDVTPGDTESLYGRSLEVTARITGLIAKDEPVLQILQNDVQAARLPLEPSESPDVFSATIPKELVRDGRNKYWQSRCCRFFLKTQYYL